MSNWNYKVETVVELLFQYLSMKSTKVDYCHFLFIGVTQINQGVNLICFIRLTPSFSLVMWNQHSSDESALADFLCQLRVNNVRNVSKYFNSPLQITVAWYHMIPLNYDKQTNI